MEGRKIIIVSEYDISKVCEALQSVNIDSSVVIIDDFRDLEQEVFEIKTAPIIEECHSLLPTKKELHSQKMEKFRKRISK